jgi:hypothetical protein
MENAFAIIVFRVFKAGPPILTERLKYQPFAHKSELELRKTIDSGHPGRI